MNYNFRQNAPAILLLIGYFVYFVLLFQISFSVAVIWMLLLVYLWIAFTLYLNTYNRGSLLYILSASGVLVSLSLFFLNGVEEVPFPEGAVVFHLEGIAQSVFLLFLCSVPILFKLIPEQAQTTSVAEQKFVQKRTDQLTQEPQIPEEQAQSNDWEEATVEDLESGDFEAL